MIKLLFSAFLIFSSLTVVPVWAATYDCNGSQSDCQAKHNAASAGDTINIASGSFTWTSPVTITKGVTFKGAGSTATTLNASNSALFNLSTGDNNIVRITDLGITGTVSGQAIGIGGNWAYVVLGNIKSRLSGSGKAVFVGYDYSNIKQTAKQKTLLYGWDFLGLTNYAYLYMIWGRYAVWTEDDDFGTDNAFFIEDSTIVHQYPNGYCGDTEFGGRLVIRYNTIINCYPMTHDANTGDRGHRLTEMYWNTITCANCSNLSALGTSGGTGVWYNNTVTGGQYVGWSDQIRRKDEGLTDGHIGSKCGEGQKACSDPIVGVGGHCTNSPHISCDFSTDCGAGTCVGPCSTDADCNTGAGNTCVQVDGAGTGGYPCRDQTGWGKDDPVTHANIRTPFYVWDNTWNGSPLNATNLSYGGYTFVQENREFYNSPKPGYSPFSYRHPKRTGEEDVTPPDILTLSPTTEQACDAASPVNINLTALTNEAADCAYCNDTVAGCDANSTYAQVLAAGAAFATTGTTSHSSTVSLDCNASYIFRYSCKDKSPAQNTMVIPENASFNIAAAIGDVTAPALSNALPVSGSYLSCVTNPLSVNLQVTAIDENTVTGKYHTSAVAYGDMSGSLEVVDGNNHSHVISLACGSVYTYCYGATDDIPNATTSGQALCTTFNVLGPTTPGVTQAESGSLVAPMAAVADATADGGYYIAIPADSQFTGTATFTVTSPATSTYRIVARVYAIDTGADSFYLTVDSNPEINWALNMPATGYNAWKTINVCAVSELLCNEYQVSLTAGEHTFVFRGREELARLDYFYLEDIGDPYKPPRTQNTSIIGGTSGETVILGTTSGMTAVLE